MQLSFRNNSAERIRWRLGRGCRVVADMLASNRRWLLRAGLPPVAANTVILALWLYVAWGAVDYLREAIVIFATLVIFAFSAGFAGLIKNDD